MTHTPRTHWLGVFTLFVAGLMAAMQFSKMSPVMSIVSDELAFSPIWAGLAVSILGLVGVVFAIIVGAIVNLVGWERGIRYALFGGGIVAVAGAFATTPTLFLLSRLLEGFSHLFIVVCAPGLMSFMATPKDKPIALAIWGCFFGLGFAIMSIIAPQLVPLIGWRGLFMGHGLAMILVGFAVRAILQRHVLDHQVTTTINFSSILASHSAVFKSGAPLLLALTFCAYTIQFLAVLTFLTLFLQIEMKWADASVGQFMAFASAITLAFTLLGGWLVRKGITLMQGFGGSFAALAAASFVVFSLRPDGGLLIASIMVMMASFGLLPGLAFANVPRIASQPKDAALTYSAFALFGNVGTFLGTPIFAAAYQSFNWQGGSAFVIVICVVGSIFTYFLAQASKRL
jgi:MFS transporter, DHA1 family, inner membrane transport protein